MKLIVLLIIAFLLIIMSFQKNKEYFSNLPRDCIGEFHPQVCQCDCGDTTYNIIREAKNGGLQCPYKQGYKVKCRPGEGYCKEKPCPTKQPETTTKNQNNVSDQALYQMKCIE